MGVYAHTGKAGRARGKQDHVVRVSGNAGRDGAHRAGGPAAPAARRGAPGGRLLHQDVRVRPAGGQADHVVPVARDQLQALRAVNAHHDGRCAHVLWKPGQGTARRDRHARQQGPRSAGRRRPRSPAARDTVQAARLWQAPRRSDRVPARPDVRQRRRAQDRPRQGRVHRQVPLEVGGRHAYAKRPDARNNHRGPAEVRDGPRVARAAHDGPH